MEMRYTQNSKTRGSEVLVALLAAQEKLTSKQIMPGQLGNNTNRHTILGVGTCGSIQHIDITPLQIIGQAAPHHFKRLARHRLIYLAPPDLRCVLFIRDNKFVLW